MFRASKDFANSLKLSVLHITSSSTLSLASCAVIDLATDAHQLPFAGLFQLLAGALIVLFPLAQSDPGHHTGAVHPIPSHRGCPGFHPVPSGLQWIPSHRRGSGFHPIEAVVDPILSELQRIPSHWDCNGSHPIGAAMGPILSGLQWIPSHRDIPAHERASKLAKENVGHNHQIIQLTIPIENLIKTQKCTRLIKHNVTIIYRTELGKLLSN